MVCESRHDGVDPMEKHRSMEAIMKNVSESYIP